MAELRDSNHYNNWLFYSLIPSFYMCAKEVPIANSHDEEGSHRQTTTKKYIEYQNIDCKCSTSNLAEAGIDTLTCLDQKIKFTASLLALRITCENKQLIRNYEAEYKSFGNTKNYLLTFDFYAMASSYSLKLVQGCMNEAKEMANDSDPEKRAVSLDFLNICLNTLQKCIGFSISKELDEVSMDENFKLNCHLEKENYEDIRKVAQKMKIGERTRRKINLMSIVTNMTLGAVTLFFGEHNEDWAVPLAFSQGLVVYLINKNLEKKDLETIGKQSYLGLKDVRSLAGIMISAVDSDIPYSVWEVVEYMGNILDVFEVNENIYETTVHYSELFSKHTLDTKYLRKFEMSIFESIYETLTRLAIFRSQDKRIVDEVWAIDHTLRNAKDINKLSPESIQILKQGQSKGTEEVKKVVNQDINDIASLINWFQKQM